MSHGHSHYHSIVKQEDMEKYRESSNPATRRTNYYGVPPVSSVHATDDDNQNFTRLPSDASSNHKRKVSYFYNSDVGRFHFGDGHPMKPARMALTHDLVINYGLCKHMEVYKPRKATDEELQAFHAEDYLQFLKNVTPDNMGAFQDTMPKYNIGVEDCPVFDGMYEFCRLYAGASLEGARKLTAGESDICINWSGGLHHAKKWEASGFCYVNDIVLAILELLRYFPRVVYIDIDVHHGDGVQEAFWETDRVMTVSFHRYDGQFFPGTGSLDECGEKKGKYTALNIPLDEKMDDKMYHYIFSTVMDQVMTLYRPGAIVLQCGADSLAGDRLGTFNLSVKGHGSCAEFMKRYNVPMLMLGGGGYTIRNVSRAWTFETSVAAGVHLPDALPEGLRYYHHFLPEPVLHPKIVDFNAENKNTMQYIDMIRERVSEYLRNLQGAPSVQMQEIPPTFSGMVGNAFGDVNKMVDEEEDRNPDKRAGRRTKERTTVDERDYGDDDVQLDVV